MKKLILIGILLFIGSMAYPAGQERESESSAGLGKVFIYTAKRFGIPIFKASIKIDNGFSEQGKPLYQIQAFVDSLPYLKFLFRMNNRFTSVMEKDTYSPIRYVKEIDQDGLLVGKKKYLQTLTFDYPNQKVVMEKTEGQKREEIFLPPDTCDPLSMFARCYLREELRPGQDLRMSIYDGVRLRQMVFHSKKEKVQSDRYGEVEAVCLESTTSFATFGDKEGIIRIWFIADGGKTPILMELELPVGKVKFELESIQRS